MKIPYYISDQPGRILAVFVLGPIILYKGLITYKDWFLICFAIILILWDLWWIICKPPRVIEQEQVNNNNQSNYNTYIDSQADKQSVSHSLNTALTTYGSYKPVMT